MRHSLNWAAQRYATIAKRIENDGFTAELAEHEVSEFRQIERVRGMIPKNDRVCAHAPCGKMYTPKRQRQRYCSEACRQAAYYRRKREGETCG